MAVTGAIAQLVGTQPLCYPHVIPSFLPPSLLPSFAGATAERSSSLEGGWGSRPQECTCGCSGVLGVALFHMPFHMTYCGDGISAPLRQARHPLAPSPVDWQRLFVAKGRFTGDWSLKGGFQKTCSRCDVVVGCCAGRSAPSCLEWSCPKSYVHPKP